MHSMLISIESILYILFLEKDFFLKFYQHSPYQFKLHGSHHDRTRFQLFKIVELRTIYRLITKKENGIEMNNRRKVFDKSSDRIARLVDKILVKIYWSNGTI